VKARSETGTRRPQGGLVPQYRDCRQ